MLSKLLQKLNLFLLLFLSQVLNIFKDIINQSMKIYWTAFANPLSLQGRLVQCCQSKIIWFKPPKCWDYRCAPQLWALKSLFSKTKNQIIITFSIHTRYFHRFHFSSFLFTVLKLIDSVSQEKENVSRWFGTRFLRLGFFLRFLGRLRE